MKKRLLYYEVIKQIEHKNALVITGMRQVGKTTLMRQIYESIETPKLWFDFDNPLDQKYFEDEEYRNVYARLEKMSGESKRRIFVFIDEIQNYPEITKIIKYLIDHYRIKFVLTGSSNFYLKNLFPESLSGRKFLYQLNPMSFREFLYFENILEIDEALKSNVETAFRPMELVDYKRLDTYYSKFLEFGGFPEIVTTGDDPTKRLVLKNIVTSFFEKDIKILSDFKDIRELRDLILLLIPRVGQMLDISRISSELGVSRVKIYAYLEILQGVFFLKLLPKYSKSIDRSVAGGKKVYFCDTGLLNTFGKVNDGQLFENAVINQFSEYGNLSYFNKRNTAEIDVILDNKLALEIKLTATPNDIIRLRKLSQSLGIEKHAVISRKYINNRDYVYPLSV